jgi:hypothetical protein
MIMSPSCISASLWLVPSPVDCPKLSQLIEALADRTKPVLFKPHITLASGFMFESMDCANNALEKLASLRGTGSVHCSVHGSAFMQDTRGGGRPLWCQAAVLLVEETDLIRTLRSRSHVLLQRPEEGTLAPPLRHLHLSVFYGTENVPSSNDINRLITSFDISSFECASLELWKTSPGDIDGVQSWVRLGSVPLS